MIEVLPGGDVRGAEVSSDPFTPIAGSMVLATADNSPLRMLEAHPAKAGNAIDLGEKSRGQWARAVGAALDMIARFLPAFRGEIDLVLRQVVPVGWDAEAHLSASYQEALGTVYLSLHPSRLTMAEAIVHEVSHNKLNALFELDPVIENDPAERHASPVRPDPRPLHGVLLAVHAFLPVARLYETMAAAATGAERTEVERHLARVRAVNAEGAGVLLARGRPTAVGRGIFDEIEREVSRYAS
jgi:HEXXH motif-containing protein